MEVKSTARVENLSRPLYKIVLYLVKVIPIVVSLIYVLNMILSYFYIDIPILAYIVQYLFIAFMYAASYTFKFCSWHRMFINYISAILTLNIIDYHWQLPISDRGMLLVYALITGIFIIIIAYLRFRVCKH